MNGNLGCWPAAPGSGAGSGAFRALSLSKLNPVRRLSVMSLIGGVSLARVLREARQL